MVTVIEQDFRQWVTADEFTNNCQWPPKHAPMRISSSPTSSVVWQRFASSVSFGKPLFESFQRNISNI